VRTTVWLKSLSRHQWHWSIGALLEPHNLCSRHSDSAKNWAHVNTMRVESDTRLSLFHKAPAFTPCHHRRQIDTELFSGHFQSSINLIRIFGSGKLEFPPFSLFVFSKSSWIFSSFFPASVVLLIIPLPGHRKSPAKVYADAPRFRRHIAVLLGCFMSIDNSTAPDFFISYE